MSGKIFIWLMITILLGTLPIQAQPQSKTFKVGWLESGITDRDSPLWELFTLKLSSLGYVEGKNIACEYRCADNKLDRLPSVADELMRLNADVIITTATPATQAAKN